MKLGAKQELFSICWAQLIMFAYANGYKVRHGQVERSKEEAIRLGFEKSLHTLRLAGDLYLFKDGKYLKNTDDYRLLGDFWRKLHPLCVWGGVFDDGNHFAISHGGRQ